MIISANEVKLKGVSIFDKIFETFNEVVINVRGKNRYIVIPFDKYEDYRTYTLDIAYKEVKEDINNDKYHTDTKSHFDNIEQAKIDINGKRHSLPRTRPSKVNK